MWHNKNSFCSVFKSMDELDFFSGFDCDKTYAFERWYYLIHQGLIIIRCHKIKPFRFWKFTRGEQTQGFQKVFLGYLFVFIC